MDTWKYDPVIPADLGVWMIFGDDLSCWCGCMTFSVGQGRLV